MKWLPTAARSPTTCLPESLKGFQESILGDPRTNSYQFYYQVVAFIEIPNMTLTYSQLLIDGFKEHKCKRPATPS
jgi:hypothetical protein